MNWERYLTEWTTRRDEFVSKINDEEIIDYIDENIEVGLSGPWFILSLCDDTKTKLSDKTLTCVRSVLFQEYMK